MSTGGGPPEGSLPPQGSALGHRVSRWRGQGYADITKLREIAAKHDTQSSKLQKRAARFQTKMDKLRHQSTVLRERAQSVLGRIPELEAEMAQHERDIKTVQQRTRGATIGSDATDLQLKVRKLQQKIVDVQHKSRTLELKAAQRTQKSAELKVKADHTMEQARLAEQEAAAYRQRADRLQAATEADLTASAGASGSAGSSHQPGGSA
jgi:chromosome segregation ATPase